MSPPKHTWFQLFSREKADVDLRIEAFNVFNSPQFGLPVAAVDDPRFGSISSTAGANRTLQVGVKVYFDSGGH